MKRNLFILAIFLVASITFVSASSSFVSTWNTALTSTGSSNSTQITLPLVSSGTYNFTVNWGDGSSNLITAYNQAQVTHNYANSGTYTLTISGTIKGWEFNNGGDKLKITDISNWGPLNLGNTGRYFYGASNLNISATDILDLTGTTSMDQAFRSSGISTVPNISSWNTSKITNIYATFFNANYFNSNIGDWNTSSVTNMIDTFYGDTSFNQDISKWDISKVDSLYGTFYQDTNFNQNVSLWNISKVNDLSYAFTRDNLSTANYDSLLNGWASLPSLQSNVNFDAGNSMYSSSAVSARNTLTSTYGWTITDGGEVGGSGGTSHNTTTSNNTVPNNSTNTTITTLSGDLNGDNKIDSLDLMVVLKYILGISRVSAADINGDGTVNIFDLVLEGKLYGEIVSSSTTAPKIIASKPSSITLPSGTKYVVLFAKTNEWATCKYSTSSSTAYSSMSSFTRTGRVSHSVNLTGLSNGIHTYYIQCQSVNGYLNSTNYVVNFTIGSVSNFGGSEGQNQNSNSTITVNYTSTRYHEPIGMTPIFNMTGGTKDWGTDCKNGAAITFYGSKWGNPSEGSIGPFTGTVSIVNDSNAPFGKAVNVAFPNGTVAGFSGMAILNFGAAYKKMYMRIIFEYNPNWQQNGGGTKLLYYGPSGHTSSFFPLMYTNSYASWLLRWVDQYSGATTLNVQSDPYALFAPGSYHTLEIYQVSEDNSTSSNGWVKMWLDGNLVSWDNLRPSPPQSINLSQPLYNFTSGDWLGGSELGTYWGGGSGTKTQNDWMRWGQIYISGSN